MNKKLGKRVPIRKRVLTIVMQTTLIALLAAFITGMFCIHWIRSSSEAVLAEQYEISLKQIVEQKAISADARLEHYEKYIEFVTDYIAEMYADEAKMIERGRLYYAPQDTTDYALTSGYAKEGMKAEDFREQLLFFSNLEQIWAPIAKSNESLITTVYAGTTTGLLTSYDRWSFLSVPPEGEEFIYDYFQSGWYTQGLKEDDVFYTDLYVDSQGRGLTITVASPFCNADGEIMGVDCADFDITALYNELLSIDLGEGARSFAIDKDGTIISPDAEEKTIEEYTGLSNEDIDALKLDSNGILEKNDAVYVCVPVERLGWTLCVSVPMSTVQAAIQEADKPVLYAMLVFVAIALVIVILAVFAVNRVAASITYPMELLGRDMKIISDGDLNYRATVHRNDEIGDITSQMNEMVDRLNFTANELRSSQQQASALSELATKDSLTGVRNKTAFDERARFLEQGLAEGDQDFGLVMVDLNNLKTINDTYGHDKGDIAIKNTCKMVCSIFAHSPVYRIGGDEFVVVLAGEDYENVAALVERFEAEGLSVSEDSSLEPWDRVSAAIGYALYDDALDTSVESVLVRADHEMYRDKGDMKRA